MLAPIYITCAEERQEQAPAADVEQPAEDIILGMEVNFAEGMIPGEETMLPNGLTAGPDLELMDQAAPDAFVVEEEIEIERSAANLQSTAVSCLKAHGAVQYCTCLLYQ